MVDSKAGLVSSTVDDGLMRRAVVGKVLGTDVISCEVLGALETVIVLVAVSSPNVLGCVSSIVVKIVEGAVGNVI